MVLGDFNLVNSLLFPTPASSYNVEDFPKELIWVPRSLTPRSTSPEDHVPCVLLQSPSARFIIIYFHSNAEDLGRCYTFCSLLRFQFQVHVLAVEYPGYGVCPGGQASEESALENAQAAFRFVREVLKWPLDGILVLGRSIGCGPALSIAAKHRVYGVVLVCPFLSVQQLCRDFVGSLAELVGERFPNKERMKLVRSPLLIIHGRQDTVVPWTHGKELYEACRARKRLVVPDEMHHNTNLHSDTAIFALPMLQFFGLPDYDFTQLTVPTWAFDKSRSPFYEEAGPPKAPMQGAPDVEPPWRIGEPIPEGLRLSAAAAGISLGPTARPANGDALGLHAGASRKKVLSAPMPECNDTAPSDASTAPSSDLNSGGAQEQNPASGRASLAVDTVDELAAIEKAASGAVSRFLQLASSRREVGEEEIEEEVVDMQPKALALAIALQNAEELPVPPEEAGFLKVPRSRACGPALSKAVAEGAKQAAAAAAGTCEATWTVAAADIIRHSDCLWNGPGLKRVASTDGEPLPVPDTSNGARQRSKDGRFWSL